MEKRALLLVLIIILVNSSIVSAGFFDWFNKITGNVVSDRCYSNAECSNLTCPAMVGQSMSLCNTMTNECYCGGTCGDGYCDTYETAYSTCPSDCSTTICSDGTPYGTCSAARPSFCSGGTLMNNCATCGCPAGTTCRGDGSCAATVSTCTDGTSYGSCSTNRPYYCSGGSLINSCGSCGCPAGMACQANGACIAEPTTCTDGTSIRTCSTNKPYFCHSDGRLTQQCSDCGCPAGSTCQSDGSCVATVSRCSDGTAYGSCSTSKPYLCSSGSLINSCSSCGCPTGMACQSNGACVAQPSTCTDGTSYGSCSTNKPYYCSSGTLINKCSTCGCPAGYSCSTTDTCQQTTTTPQNNTQNVCSTTQNGVCPTNCATGSDYDCCINSGKCWVGTSGCTTCANNLCSDGTQYEQCSASKPKYCSSGMIINKCSYCGCPAGQVCQADGSCQGQPTGCGDGTPFWQCSANKPYYCMNGSMALKCSQCGCPAGLVCQTDESCQIQRTLCTDGTAYELCSTIKPYYCDNGYLVNKCSLCGCPEGHECMEDGICKERESIQEQQRPPVRPEQDRARQEQEPVQECNNGCMFNNRCIPFGVRVLTRFCDVDTEIKEQLEGDATCNNNYECKSNLCVDSVCTAPGFTQNIIQWLTNLFRGGAQPEAQEEDRGNADANIQGADGVTEGADQAQPTRRWWDFLFPGLNRGDENDEQPQGGQGQPGFAGSPAYDPNQQNNNGGSDYLARQNISIGDNVEDLARAGDLLDNNAADNDTRKKDKFGKRDEDKPMEQIFCEHHCDLSNQLGKWAEMPGMGGEKDFGMCICYDYPKQYYCCWNHLWHEEACYAHTEDFCVDWCEEMCYSTGRNKGRILGSSEGEGNDRYKCDCYDVALSSPQYAGVKQGTYYCCDSRVWKKQPCDAHTSSYCESNESPTPLSCSQKCALEGKSGKMNGTSSDGNNRYRCECYTPPPQEPAPPVVYPYYNDEAKLYCCAAANGRLSVEQSPCAYTTKQWKYPGTNTVTCTKSTLGDYQVDCNLACQDFGYISGTLDANNLTKCVCEKPTYHCCGPNENNITAQKNCKMFRFDWKTWDNSGVTGPACWKTKCEDLCKNAGYNGWYITPNKQDCTCIKDADKYKCCTDDSTEPYNPSWTQYGRLWVPTEDQCPAGLTQGWPDHCNQYPIVGSCAKVCGGTGYVVHGEDANGYCTCASPGTPKFDILYCCGTDKTLMSVKNNCTTGRYEWKTWAGSGVTGEACWKTTCDASCNLNGYARGSATGEGKTQCKCEGVFEPPPPPGEAWYYCCRTGNARYEWVDHACTADWGIESYQDLTCADATKRESCALTCARLGKKSRMLGNTTSESPYRYKCSCYDELEVPETDVGYKRYYCCSDRNNKFAFWINGETNAYCPYGFEFTDIEYCERDSNEYDAVKCDDLCQDKNGDDRGQSCYCEANVGIPGWQIITNSGSNSFDLRYGKTTFSTTGNEFKLWAYAWANAPKNFGADSQNSRISGYDYKILKVTAPEGQSALFDIEIDVYYAGVIDELTSGIGPAGGAQTDYAAIVKAGIVERNAPWDSGPAEILWTASTDQLARFIETAIGAVVDALFGEVFGDAISIAVTLNSQQEEVEECSDSVGREETVKFENVKLERGEYTPYINLDIRATAAAAGLAAGYAEVDFYNTKPDNCDDDGHDIPTRGIAVKDVRVQAK